MNIEKGKKYLFTVAHWVLANDGKEYKGIFGTVTSFDGNTVEVGCIQIPISIVIASMRSSSCNTGNVDAPWWNDGKHGVYENRHSMVFDADKNAEISPKIVSLAKV